jgi:hypothetical protein
MELFQLINCARGKHLRSRDKAWHDGNILHSECCGCGRPMVKDFHGWKLEDASPKGASDRR